MSSPPHVSVVLSGISLASHRLSTNTGFAWTTNNTHQFGVISSQIHSSKFVNMTSVSPKITNYRINTLKQNIISSELAEVPNGLYGTITPVLSDLSVLNCLNSTIFNSPNDDPEPSIPTETQIYNDEINIKTTNDLIRTNLNALIYRFDSCKITSINYPTAVLIIYLQRVFGSVSFTSCEFYTELGNGWMRPVFLEAEPTLFPTFTVSRCTSVYFKQSNTRSGNSQFTPSRSFLTTFSDSSFTAPSPYYSGMTLMSNPNSIAYTQLVNCHFERQSGSSDGGTLSMDYSVTHFFDCSFVDCYSPAMGGAMRTANAYNIFHRCTFRDNVAQTRGGAIRFSYPKMVYFEDCHFFDNEANEMVGGQKAKHRGADIHVTSATVGMLFETQMIGCSSSSSDPRIGYFESVLHNGAPQNMDAYLPSQPTGRKAGYDMFLTLTGTDDLPAITGIVADLNADGTGLVLKVTGTGLPITGQYTITFADVVTTQVVLNGASITETDEGTCELFPNTEAKYGQTYLANVSHNEYQLSNQNGISFTVPLGPARVFSATAALNADDELKVIIHGQNLTVGALYTFELVTEVDTRTYTAEATSATEIESILIPITEVDPTPIVHSVSCTIGDTLTSLRVTLNGLNLPIGTELTVVLNSTESIVFTVGDSHTTSTLHETSSTFEFSTEYSIDSITCDDNQYTITFPNGLSFTTSSAPSTDPTVHSVSCTLGDTLTSLLVTLHGTNLPIGTALTVELNSTESIVFTVGDGNTVSKNHETRPNFEFSTEYSIDTITCDDPQYTITFPNGLSFTTPAPTPPKRQVLNWNQTYIIQNFSPDTTITEHSILSDDLCFTVPSTDPTVHSVSCAIGDTLTSLRVTLNGLNLPIGTELTVVLNSTESIVFTVGDSHTTSTLHETSSTFEFSTEYSIDSITCDDNQYTITFPNGLSFTTPSDPTPPAIVPPSLPFQPVCSSEKPCGTFTTIFAKIHDPDSTAKTSLNLVNIGYGDFADITRTFNNSVDLAGKGHVSHSPSSTRLTIDGYIVGTSGNLSVRAMVLKPSSAAVSLFTVNDPTANLRISLVRIEKLTNHVVPLFDLSEGLTYVNVSIFDTISLTKDAMISVTGSASICMSMSWLMQITRLSGTGGSCMDSFTSGSVNITYTDVAECYSTGNAGAFSHSSPGTATTYLNYNSIIFADNFGNSNPDGTKVTADLEVMGNDFVYLDYVSGTCSVLNTVRSMSEMPHYHNGQESLSVVHPSVHFYEYSVRQPVGARFEYGLPINQFKGFNASLESLVEGSDAVMFKITTSQFILIDPCVVCKHSWQVGYPKLVPQYFDRTLIECQNAGTMRLYSLQLHLNQTLTAAPFVVTDETGPMQFYAVTLFFNVTEQRAPLISCEHGYIDCWYVSLYGERGVDFVGHSMFEANGKASTLITSNFNRVRSDVNGSVLNTLKGNVTFDRSICQNCVARYGGALYMNFEADSFLVVIHPESSAFTESFSNNVAIGDDGTVDDPMGKGGALYLKGSPTSASAIRFNNTLINHARFENNKALNGTDIFIEKSVLAPIDIATTLGFGGGSYSDFFRIVIEDREFEELVELERISLLLPTPIISVNGSVKEPLTGMSGVDNVICKWASSFCSTLGYGVTFLNQKYQNKTMMKQYVQFVWNMTYTENSVVLSDQDLVIAGWKTSDQSKSTITRTLFVMDPLSDEGTFLVTLIKNACALFKGIDFKPTEKCGMFEVLDDAGELELNDVAFIFKSGLMYECPMIRTTLCPFTLTNVKFNTTEASSASFTTPLLYYQTNLDFTLVDVSFETLEMKSSPAVELITEGDISLQNVKFQGCTRQDAQQGKYIRVTATEFRIKRLPTLWAGCFEATQPLADFTGRDLFLGDQHEWYEASLMYYLLPPTTRIHLDNNNLEASTHPNCGSDRLVCSSIDSSYRSAKSNSITMIELSTDAPLLKPLDITMACTIRSGATPKTLTFGLTGGLSIAKSTSLVLTEINMDAESGTRTSAAITASGTVTVSQASFTSAAPVTITSALVSVTGGSFEMTGHDITNISSSASLFDVSSGSLLLDAVTVVWNGKGSTVVKQSKGTAELHTCTLSMSAVASILYVDSLFEVSGGELLVSSLTMNGGSSKIGSLLSATGGTTHIYDVDFQESKLAGSLVSGSGVVDIRKASFTQLSGQTSAANSGGTHAVSFIVRTGHVLSIGAQNDEVAFNSCTSPENGGALAVEIYGTGKLLITHTSFASCTTSGAGGALSIVCGQGVTSDSLVLKATYLLCMSDSSNHEDWIYLTGYFLSTVINPDNWEGYPDTWNSTTELYLAGEDKAKVGTAFHELTLLFYLIPYYNKTIYTGAYGVDASGCGAVTLPCANLDEADLHLNSNLLCTIAVVDATQLKGEVDLRQDKTEIVSKGGDKSRVDVSESGSLVNAAANLAHSLHLDALAFSLPSDRSIALLQSRSGMLTVTSCSFSSSSSSSVRTTHSLIACSGGSLIIEDSSFSWIVGNGDGSVVSCYLTGGSEKVEIVRSVFTNCGSMKGNGGVLWISCSSEIDSSSLIVGGKMTNCWCGDGKKGEWVFVEGHSLSSLISEENWEELLSSLVYPSDMNKLWGIDKAEEPTSRLRSISLLSLFERNGREKIFIDEQSRAGIDCGWDESRGCETVSKGMAQRKSSVTELIVVSRSNVGDAMILSSESVCISSHTSLKRGELVVSDLGTRSSVGLFVVSSCSVQFSSIELVMAASLSSVSSSASSLSSCWIVFGRGSSVSFVDCVVSSFCEGVGLFCGDGESSMILEDVDVSSCSFISPLIRIGNGSSSSIRACEIHDVVSTTELLSFCGFESIVLERLGLVNNEVSSSPQLRLVLDSSFARRSLPCTVDIRSCRFSSSLSHFSTEPFVFLSLVYHRCTLIVTNTTLSRTLSSSTLDSSEGGLIVYWKGSQPTVLRRNVKTSGCGVIVQQLA
ncbi:hypothetical protein BLNAU_19463 [Blattamonas nauphoetae]|uniref:Uncharacterized protein n=1 Tax=Blattamonas nauphoetae TaxID=2049346 RepID=A0ABQ9X1E9_9EUKA|nr:hypothetical protein BLNAU_19463 [Blattamonas nauphoetae]